MVFLYGGIHYEKQLIIIIGVRLFGDYFQLSRFNK